MMTTALEQNELVREIQIKVKPGKTGSAYRKMEQKASGFAICGAAAMVELDGSGALSNVAIGITGVGSCAFRAAKTEAALKGQKPTAEALKKACETAGDGIIALEDIHASADYRLDLARVFARRALEAAIERAG
jgi:carbon-monoxide dehydrogenase medium subunit